MLDVWTCLVNRLPLHETITNTHEFMKKLFLLVLLAFMFVNATFANDVTIGYCNGVVNKSSTFGATGRAWVDAAIYLPDNIIRAYAANDIKSVNVGLASSINVDTVRVWVRSSLEGSNLAEGEIVKGSIVRGWNSVSLKQPYLITGQESGLYIGYSFKQRGSVNAISFVPTATQNAFWAKLGSSEDWKDYSSQGTLSLEAVISGDNIYKYDVGISNQTALNVSNTNSISITATFKNYGTETVKALDLTVASKDGSFKKEQHLDIDIPSGQSVERTFEVTDVPLKASLSNDMRIAIDKINGEEDQNPSNDQVDLIFARERKVVIEEFTSEGCGNCPRLVNTIKTVISRDEFLNKTVTICHHDGFSTDFLSKPADTEYLWFFNAKSTYAPALMLDRYPYFTNSENKVTPVFDPDDTELAAGIRDRLSIPTYTKLNIKAVCENADRVHVVVDGFKAKPFCNTPARITLYLLEDSIKARNQVGAGDGFMHMHVERDINSTWGEVIDWKADGSFTYEYDIDIADYWKKNHLSIVAFISSYDEGDVTNCVIENAEVLPLRDIFTAGINGVSACDNSVAGQTVYALDGREVASDKAHDGLFIVKTKYSDGSMKTSKQYIK